MDNTLTAKLLSAPLVCKGFISGMDDCDYEIYLREVVNASEYFKRMSNGAVYTAPPEEAHGEWDCISADYSLDFKLIASETALRARNLFSSGIHKMAEGVTVYTVPKITSNNPKYKPIRATRIYAALRSLDLATLKTIRNTKEKTQGIETDIRALLETLETQKHILMFFPYEFFTETDNDFPAVVSEVIEVLSQDFSEAFKYRKEVAPEFDAYFVFIYAGQFVIMELCENTLKLIDTVTETSSPTYMKIKDYTDWV